MPWHHKAAIVWWQGEAFRESPLVLWGERNTTQLKKSRLLALEDGRQLFLSVSSPSRGRAPSLGCPATPRGPLGSISACSLWDFAPSRLARSSTCVRGSAAGPSLCSLLPEEQRSPSAAACSQPAGGCSSRHWSQGARPRSWGFDVLSLPGAGGGSP